MPREAPRHTITIIAECAQGPNGDVGLALEFVSAAARAKANIVKFQLVQAQELATPDYEHYDLFRSSELLPAEWTRVAAACRSTGVDLALDVFGPHGLEIALGAGCSIVKLHASDSLNPALLKQVAASELDLILLGTGGSTLTEIQRAARLLEPGRVVLMHGHQAYPTPADELAICRVQTLGRAFPGMLIGYADHIPAGDRGELWLPTLSIALGADFIEKHFALPDSTRDREAALDPGAFSTFVDACRLAEQALGAEQPDGGFTLLPSEMRYRAISKKHVVAARAIREGDTLAATDLALKRTSSTDPVLELDAVIGRVAATDLPQDAPIEKNFLT